MDSTDDQLLAIIAHSLLNSLSVIHGTAITLEQAWERLDDDRRQEFLATMTRQSEHVIGVLKDLIRSGPPEVIAALTELDRRPRTSARPPG